jgi:dipeptidyl aminopeptidase/acylaminoacyl peptidase
MSEVLRYGPHPDQFVEVSAPERAPAAVVLIHGGNWRPRYGCDLMRPLAADLAGRGYATANLEYRRTGWPGTAEDVAAGLDTVHKRLAGVAVALVGHSAGGQLALCAARHRPPGVSLVVSLAGVTDLVESARLELSHGAVRELLGGGPDEVPDRYRAACPTLLLPLGVPQLVVHGTDDADVPYPFAPRYADAARAAGDACELLALPGVEHFALIDPGSAAWAAVVARLDRWAGYAPGTKMTSTQ